MATRKVIGKVYKTDGTPWLNTPIQFRRVAGSFDATTQYPPDTAKAITDNQGVMRSLNGATLGVDLWVNESGELPSVYTCLLPRDRFEFSLPAGDGSPIELSALRSGMVPHQSSPQSILNYIDEKFNSIVNSEQSPQYLKIQFSNVNIINGIYTFDQSLGTFPFVTIKNDLGQIVFPPVDYEGQKIHINFSGFTPISGNWELHLGKKFDNFTWITISQGDLTNGEYTFTHGLNRTPFIQLLNSLGKYFFPDSIQETQAGQIRIDLSSFQPVSGVKLLVA